MILIIILLLLFLYALYEYRNIKVNHLWGSDFNSRNPKLGKRIVFLSDIQYDHSLGFNHSLMRKVVTLINDQKPDYIILGGDMIHKKRKSYPVFSYLEKLEGIKIAVLGNHDYYDKALVLSELKTLGIQTLVNETYEIDGITFVGVDDLRCGKPHLPDDLGSYNILITHEPDFFETITTPFNIALAGHLHGGQVTLFGRYAPILPSDYNQKYRSGMIQNTTSSIYVSKGLGGFVFGFPLRFFACPEIVVIDI